MHEFRLEILKGKDHLQDPDVDVRIKSILVNRFGGLSWVIS